jgi:hypothetical protein
VGDPGHEYANKPGEEDAYHPEVATVETIRNSVADNNKSSGYTNA